jgi:hypothetical protein
LYVYQAGYSTVAGKSRTKWGMNEGGWRIKSPQVPIDWDRTWRNPTISHEYVHFS